MIKRYGKSRKDYIGNVISKNRRFIVTVDEDDQNNLQIIERQKNLHYFTSYSSSIPFNKHNDSISHLSFSPNNRFLVSASEDNTVKLWKLDNWLKNSYAHRDLFFKEQKNNFDKSLSVIITPVNQDLGKLKVSIWQNGQSLTARKPIVMSNFYRLSFSPSNQHFITSSTLDYSYATILKNDGRETALKTDNNSVRKLIISPDGKTIATISSNSDGNEKFIQLWNQQGDPIKKLKHYQVEKLHFSLDSKTLASISENQIKFWTKDGRLINSFDGHNEKIEGTIFSLDEQLIATRSHNKIKLLNLNSKLVINLEGHYQQFQAIGFSPDSQIITSIGDDNFVKLWRRDGTYIGTLEHTDQITSLSFSRDSKRIITFSSNSDRPEKRMIKLWQSNGTLIKQYQIDDYVINFLRLSPDAKAIVYGSSKLVKLWNLDRKSTKTIETMEKNYGKTNDVEFSSDGEIIAIANDDKTIRLWNSEDGQEIKTLRGHKHPVKNIIFSPGGNFFASMDNDGEYAKKEETIIFWDIEGNRLKNIEGNQLSFLDYNNTISSVSYNPKCGTLIFWQRDGKKLETPEEYEFCEEFASFLDYTSDGQIIAWSKREYPLRLWNINGELIKTFKGHNARVSSVSFSPDGTKIVSGSYDKTIKIWNSKNGEEINTIEENDEVNTVTFSPDGRTILSGSDDKTLKLWSLDGTLIDTFKGHTSTLWKATFSPDGKMIASVGNDIDDIILWDSKTREIKKRIKNNEGVKSISFSPDSDILAIERKNGKVTLYLLNGIFTQKTHLYTTNSFLGEKFSPDGKAIAVQNQSGVLLLNADLDDLLNRACNWASAYLKTTENEDIKHLCD
ncbi:WD40 repeat domain-containing protein [Okeania sp. KiyG1]|uniref:WD40 repeat domain-containing protein n=1 Tax=Okeania sp. KiyG1 TaxID=2720165 RepID=UPI001922AE61|nr:WD40 repeat domain-containing protein [Okeania sp. KiyG1]